jgi:GT2 family glycosyltransferase
MQPVVSVVVPTYLRPDKVVDLLGALQSLDFAKEAFEVIVVNDGGPSNLEPLCACAAGLNLRMVTQAHAGPARARNRGAACASGRYLVFSDDDCVPDRDWLNEFLAVLDRFPEHLVAGRVVNAALANRFSCASQQIADYLHGYFNDNLGHARFFPSNNIAMSAKLFQSVGGFHSGFPLAGGEDREFCHRWHRRGFPMTYAPAAIVHHTHYLTLKSYWRQHFGYGRGARIFRSLARETGDPVSFERLAFYRGLLASRARDSDQARHALLIAISQAAVASGYLRETLHASRPPAVEPEVVTAVQPGVRKAIE